MRWLLGIIVALLRRFADAASLRLIGILEDDKRELRAEITGKDSRISILEAEVEYLTEWRAKEIESLTAEAAINRARSTIAQVGSLRDE